MQVISELYEDPEAYVSGELHGQVRPPSCCPRCQRQGSLGSLGYYRRYVLFRGAEAAVRIPVRRFRCKSCSVTVSVLPVFAQPHHLLGNDVLDDILAGRVDPQRNWFAVTLFKGMLKRFGRFRERLYAVLGLGFGRDPPETSAPDQDHLRWLWLKNQSKFSTATQNLVRHYRCTVFGRYRCHEPT